MLAGPARAKGGSNTRTDRLNLTNEMTSGGGDTSTVYGPLFAAYVLASLPLFLLFVFASKHYIQGLISSGLKL